MESDKAATTTFIENIYSCENQRKDKTMMIEEK